MGADSICIKDMAGLLLPYKSYKACTGIEMVHLFYSDAYIIHLVWLYSSMPKAVE